MTGCRMACTENFGDLVLSEGTERREDWNVCRWSLAVGECCRELVDEDCHLISEIGGKVISSQNKCEGVEEHRAERRML